MTEKKASPSSSDFRAIKIDNAAWLPQIAEHIATLCKKAHVAGIQPSNLQTYFAQAAQGWFGKDVCEFWMVFENEVTPVAFACWQVSGLPYISRVFCLAIHSWAKSGKPVDLLTDEWIKFGDRWRAAWWAAEFVEDGVERLFKSKMKKRGFGVTESGIKNMVFRRQDNVI
jgi:hypothetical protein